MKQKTPDRNTGLSVQEWSLVETDFRALEPGHRASLFSLANGFLGTRGDFEEDWAPGAAGLGGGTYVNGIYDREEIPYHETYYGRARNNDSILNLPNAKAIDLIVDGRRFDMLDCTVAHYRRVLDFRSATLTRSLVWKLDEHRSIELRTTRFVSMATRQLLAIAYEITPLGFAPSVELVSALDWRRESVEAGDDPRIGSFSSTHHLVECGASADGMQLGVVQDTLHSGITAAVAVEHAVQSGRLESSEANRRDKWCECRFRFRGAVGELIRLAKFAAYDFAEVGTAAAAGIGKRVADLAATAASEGFDAQLAAHRQALDRSWSGAEIAIDGSDADQALLRLNVFHLLQSGVRHGACGIPAKGLSGEGYAGHYFWDSEIFVLRFFLYTDPPAARNLLAYRHRTIDRARSRAREMGHARGALFPWRTISGDECSPFFPAGTAQYHINADIAFAVRSYLEATGDWDFILEMGAEIVIEGARMWADLGAFIPHRGNRFCINEVTGPDEYTAMVNNNFYTNAMAQMHLRLAARLAAECAARDPRGWRALSARIGLAEVEIAAWRKAADAMYLPYDEAFGIHPQDDSFLDKAVWGFAATPPENYPLLLHYHPLVIYRHQVCKQADVVLAMELLGNAFTLADKRRDFDYYEKLTTHDSTLSASVFSIVAAEVGHRDKAYAYFRETAGVDLYNLHGNSGHGLHMAALAGSWNALVFGFAGMRAWDGRLSFAPQLPEAWRGYRIHIAFQGRRIAVEVSGESATYRLLSGAAIEIEHYGQAVSLTTGGSAERELSAVADHR